MSRSHVPSKSEQERTNRFIVVPELDEILEDTTPWGEIGKIILNYYPKFAEARKVSKLSKFIEEQYGVKLSANSLGKRYERIK